LHDLPLAGKWHGPASLQTGQPRADLIDNANLGAKCRAILDPNQSNDAKSEYASPNGKKRETMPQDRYQTVQEVADRLEVAEATVRQWIKAGALRAIDIGKGWRISDTDLAQFLTTRETSPRNGAAEVPSTLASPSLPQTPDRGSKIS
jgi:excisionase family DNA binding protein